MSEGRSRVVIVTTVHPICDVRILYREARSLARAGYEVEVVGPPPGPETDFGLEGIRLTLIPRETHRLRRVLVGGVRLVPLLLRRRADVYHLHDPELLWVGLLLRLTRRRVVFDLHEDLPLQVLAKEWIPSFLRGLASWIASALLRATANRFQGVIAATDAVAERFARRARPVVVRNLPVLDVMPTPSAHATRDTFRVAYVGRLSRDRGTAQMLQALDQLARNDIELLLIGGVSPDVRRDLEARSGDPRVHIVPWGPPLQVYARLAEATVGLVCLHPVRRYVDALPVKLFEYMAMGLPVVASDFPGFRRIVADAGCGLLIDPLDSGQLAEAIRFLIDSPEECRRLGRNGRRAVEEHYNWRLEEGRLLDLYARLVQTAGQ